MRAQKLFVVSLSLILALTVLGTRAVMSQGRDDPPETDGTFRVPVVVDGVLYQPEEAARFEGVQLYSLVTADAVQQGIMYAFTTCEGLLKFLSEQGRPAPPNCEPKARKGGPGDYYILKDGEQEASVLIDWTKFWKDINQGGGEFGSAPYVYWEDLRYTPSGWNDVISSLQVGNVPDWAILYQNVYGGGDQLWAETGVYISDLRDYGWNDRASSIAVDSSVAP